MSDDVKKTELVAYMRRINDGSALSETLREARALKAETESLRAENARLKAALVRLRDCDWVIRLPDRMDAVREIARKALEAKE